MTVPTPPGDIRATIRGQNSGQIVVGHGNQVLNLDVASGAVLQLQQLPLQPITEPWPRPVDVRPRPGRDPGGRWEPEVRQAIAALANRQCVELWGPDPAVRTRLVRFLAYQSVVERFPAGVAYIDAARQTKDDLLQALYQVFYWTRPPARFGEVEIRQALRGLQALIFLDNAQLGSDVANDLLNALPDFTFVLTGAGPQLGDEGCSIPLRKAEPVAPFIPPKAAGSAGPSRIMAAMAVLGGAAATAADLGAIAGLPDPGPALAQLLAEGAIATEDNLYVPVAGLTQWAEANIDLAPYRAAAAAHFAERVTENREHPEGIMPHISLLLLLLEAAVAAGEWAVARKLGLALEPVVAGSGRWGLWQSLLELLREGAEAAGDTAATGYFVHQLGTRALCLGEAGARSLLELAMTLRNGLGDAGVAATCANLELVQQAALAASAPVAAGLEAVPAVASGGWLTGIGNWVTGVGSWVTGVGHSFAGHWVVPAVAAATVAAVGTTVVVLGDDPVASLSADTVPFGEVVVEEPETRIITLSNTGTGQLRVERVEIDPQNGTSGFAVAFDPGSCAAIEPDAPCTAELTFTPKKPVPHDADVVFVLSDGKKVRAKLTGKGMADVVLKTLDVPFGETGVDTIRTSIELQNRRKRPLTVSHVTTTDPNFSVDPTSCTAAPIEPSSSCHADLAFTPDSSGAKIGNVVFSLDGGKTVIANMSGTGLEGIWLKPARLEFPNTILGGTPARSSIELFNRRTDPLTIESITFPPQETPSEFGLAARNCIGTQIPPGGSCRSELTFAPSRFGVAEREAHFNQLGAGTVKAALRGGGKPTPYPAVWLEPETLSFGKAVVRDSPVKDQVTLTNIGPESITFTSVKLDGTGAASFRVEQTCTVAPIPSGGTCRADLTFAPDGRGEKVAALVFESPEVKGVRVPLSGFGLQGKLTFWPTRLDFFGLFPMLPWYGEQTVTVSNTGDAALRLTRPGLNGPDAGDFVIKNETCTDKDLIPRGSCLITLTFDPKVIGKSSATLGFPDMAETPGIPVTGTRTGNIPDLPLPRIAVWIKGSQATVQLMNVGLPALTVWDVRPGTESLNNFVLDGQPCRGAVLALGRSCSVTVQATTTILDRSWGTLVFFTSAGEFSVNLVPTVTLPWREGI